MPPCCPSSGHGTAAFREGEFCFSTAQRLGLPTYSPRPCSYALQSRPACRPHQVLPIALHALRSANPSFPPVLKKAEEARLSVSPDQLATHHQPSQLLLGLRTGEKFSVAFSKQNHSRKLWMGRSRMGQNSPFWATLKATRT